MTSQKEPKEGSSSLTKVTGPSSWSRVSCPCCTSSHIEPLVLIQLAESIQPITKQWIMSVISAPVKTGGAQLLVHPGEDMKGDMIVVAAPRCTLLRVTEDLGLCKTYHDGNMTAFSFDDRDNFCNIDDMQKFLTLAERQYIIKYQMDSMRAMEDQRIPGIPTAKGKLKARESILQKLEKAGVIRNVTPLHEQKLLTALGKQWYSQKSLWGQPLDSIHAYFGGTIAYYFSFLDFYTLSLFPPAILGLFITFFLPSANFSSGNKTDSEPTPPKDDDDQPSVSSYMVQAVFSMLWSTIFMELWKRRSASLSYRWGTFNLAEQFQEPRPGFHGELGTNPVTGRLEPLFPEWKRRLRMGLVSVPVVGVFLGLVVMGMAGFYFCERLVSNWHKGSGSYFTAILLYLPSIAHIVYTNVLGNIYRNVALRLTESENHREESSFDYHHTTKVLVFTFFNNFAVLFHIAFFKEDMPLLRKRLASLLIVTQVVNQFTEVVVPFLVDRFLTSGDRNLKEDDPEVDRLQAQGSLPAFPGLFAEYIELLVQFGYLSLFSCVYPLTAPLLLLNNLTEIRTDAYKLCKLFNKPFSAPVANMGVWQPAFEVLSFISVMSNCWLLLLSPRVREFTQEAGLSTNKVLVIAVIVEHVLIMVKMILAFMIPDEPDWLRIKREQIEYHSMQALKKQRIKSSRVDDKLSPKAKMGE
ncbi:anoctamin-10 [Megalobrama amblycephala]|uniref:anoctamin-10 n=1 Tax=Megalobrama amblycephala TaxID=75352 RepID=UPI002014695D|nr:anoctamin-10 [Megalobrama amblycephala]XP_048013947.1 anoctamin-10 [Megalobrama amblycephala]XP_048013948.1 anoctamin-10 [Megalobrama amblycephala]XP_048013949.1 anoctamin-10 [Megalobrama amblycephala]XP_048013950.1 anoctamin-10 [Megalobrama amblycephala]XP_048013951.1 anoctamin-10 [Megalobrama amblycephala]XP_048013952.1 anoctamin-10 [Megalobrama amblycephala]XP_048013953.1 anoctamin-10 [Megalobrama amblycephala]